MCEQMIFRYAASRILDMLFKQISMNPFELIDVDRYRGDPFSVPCPHCGSVATYEKDKVKFFRTHESNIALDTGNAEWDANQGTIVGHCRCTNDKCQEYTHFIGSYFTTRDEFEEPVQFYEMFRIKYFFPPVPFIQIPAKTPKKISDIVKRSFAPAFFDQSASGHLLRYAIEELLTVLKVPRFGLTTKGKKYRLTLYSRIERLPLKLHSHKDKLQAIRWLGNAATHDDLKVNNLKLLYEIADKLLEALYGTGERELLREIKQILRRA